MEIIPDKRKVVGLVEQAYQAKLCLPDFQRDFMTRSSEKVKMKRKKMTPEEWRAEKARRDDLTRRLLAKIEELRKLTEGRRAAGAE